MISTEDNKAETIEQFVFEKDAKGEIVLDKNGEPTVEDLSPEWVKANKEFCPERNGVTDLEFAPCIRKEDSKNPGIQLGYELFKPSTTLDKLIKYLGEDLVLKKLVSSFRAMLMKFADEATDSKTKEFDKDKFLGLIKELKSTSTSMPELKDEMKLIFVQLQELNDYGKYPWNEEEGCYARKEDRLKSAQVMKEFHRLNNEIEDRKRPRSK